MKISSEPSSLYADFIHHTTNGTGEFDGGVDFSNKIKKVIAKAVQLKSGRALLTQLLDSGKPISIIKSESGCCGVRMKNGTRLKLDVSKIKSPLDFKETAIALNFEKKIYYLGLNQHGEVQFQKEPAVVVFLHEATHLKHLFENPEKMRIRCLKGSAIPYMDNQEEELTITGVIQKGEEHDACSENSVLAELDLPLRLNHQGAIDLEKLSPRERAKFIVLFAALGNLRHVRWPENSDEATAFSTEMLKICFYQMKSALLMEKISINPRYGASNLYVGRWEEYERILFLLMEKGGVPGAAFAYLIDAVKSVYNPQAHAKWMQIIGQCIQKGYGNSKIFKEIINEARLHNEFETKQNWLNLIARFATDFAAENMMQIMEAFVQEDCPEIKKAWGEIILSASEQNSSKLLHGLIGNASRAEHERIKLQWLDLALERMDSAMCDAQGSKSLEISLKNAAEAEDLTLRQKWLEIISGLRKAGNSR